MPIDLPNQILSAIRFVVGDVKAPLHEPVFWGNEWKYLKECLDTTYVSSIGNFVTKFESDLATFTGAKYAVAVVNGTAALHIALKLAGVQPTDEVLTPSLTFVATANAIIYCGASPHFVDSEEHSLGIDVGKLRLYLKENTEQVSGYCLNKLTGKIVRAIIPMHTFGHPGDIDGLIQISNEFNITIVEDAAESIGSKYNNRHTGTFGLMGTLSFNGNKTITTGGGGAILTNDKDLALRARHITTTAKVSNGWEFIHDEVGYNYRMPNLNAALGCAQLESLPAKLQAKRDLYNKYSSAFARLDKVKLLNEPKNCSSNFWLQTLLLEDENLPLRDSILELTNGAGIMTRPAWNLLHELRPFRTFPRMNLSTAKSLSTRLINIPSSSNLALKT